METITVTQRSKERQMLDIPYQTKDKNKNKWIRDTTNNCTEMVLCGTIAGCKEDRSTNTLIQRRSYLGKRNRRRRPKQIKMEADVQKQIVEGDD